jgi:C4-dicarboxylate transporter DctM subunit
VGFVASLVITGLVLRTLSWRAFTEAAFDAMATTVAILLIIAGAKVFGKAITLYRMPQELSVFISIHVETVGWFVLAVSAVLLLMGLIFETLSMILIMTPALRNLGVDPIWFGIYMVIMVECALITPPVGLNLYVIQAVAKVQLGEVARAVLPFFVLMLVTVVVMYFWPDLALYLPFKL